MLRLFYQLGRNVLFNNVQQQSSNLLCGAFIGFMNRENSLASMSEHIVFAYRALSYYQDPCKQRKIRERPCHGRNRKYRPKKCGRLKRVAQSDCVKLFLKHFQERFGRKCCEECVEPPRYDYLYYRPSDKTKVCYKRTWPECPIRKRPKRNTCFPKEECVRLPEIQKRPKRKIPKICGFPSKCEDPKCRRIRLPYCARARVPPSCKRKKVRVCCQKIPTPLPSFSECRRDRPSELRQIECDCWQVDLTCFIPKRPIC